MKTQNTFSLADKHIVVNYHHIREPSQEWSGIYPCSPKEFERQINFLTENFKIVSVPQVYEAAQEESQEKLCALTFDDCLKGVYKYALPLLAQKNITASFFPITSTFQNNLPYTHKAHIALSKFSAEELIDSFNNYLATDHPDFLGRYKIPKDRRIENRRDFDDTMTANFKETLIAISAEVRDDFLAHLFKEVGLKDKELAKQFFMSRQEILDLKNSGMDIGYHSHGHFPYNIATKDKIEKDIKQNKEQLFNLLGQYSKMFSYPNGRASEEAISVLKSEGVEHALTIEKRGVKKGDDPFLIPRYDTNNIKDYLDIL